MIAPYITERSIIILSDSQMFQESQASVVPSIIHPNKTHNQNEWEATTSNNGERTITISNINMLVKNRKELMVANNSWLTNMGEYVLFHHCSVCPNNHRTSWNLVQYLYQTVLICVAIQPTAHVCCIKLCWNLCTTTTKHFCWSTRSHFWCSIVTSAKWTYHMPGWAWVKKLWFTGIQVLRQA